MPWAADAIVAARASVHRTAEGERRMRMKVLKTFRPNDAGAKRLRNRFGESLVCVRYRLDELNDTLSSRWSSSSTPRGSDDASPAPPRIPPAREDTLVAVTVHYRETAARELVKQAGGRWRPELRAWELPLSVAERVGLANRIVPQREMRPRAAPRPTDGNA
jgi:hypothetical protein